MRTMKEQMEHAVGEIWKPVITIKRFEKEFACWLSIYTKTDKNWDKAIKKLKSTWNRKPGIFWRNHDQQNYYEELFQK